MECSLCPNFQNEKEAIEIVKLKCHTFCWTCLDEYLKKNLKPKIKCPVDTCDKFVPDNIIRKTLSEENILKYERLSLEGLQQSHRCLLPQCNVIIFYSDKNIQYECQLCTLYNCIVCNSAHAFVTCAQYQVQTDDVKKRICDQEMDRAKESLKAKQRIQMRKNLLLEDKQDILKNEYAFSCWLCNSSIAKEQGVKLRDCSHLFCGPCLSQHIVKCSNIPVLCPMGCPTPISDREIQSLLPEDQMAIYQTKYNILMKKKNSNHFQCKSPNCDSLYFYEKRPSSFNCVNCGNENCVPCGVVHDQETCEQYRYRMEMSLDSKHIEESIKKKLMMKCPDCQHLLHKTRGCNWIQCDRCSVELCWILQMHRWGPKGRGDMSGGCKCGVNKKFCHPDCRGCIPDRR